MYLESDYSFALVLSLAAIAQNTQWQYLHHTVPMHCTSTRSLQFIALKYPNLSLNVVASPFVARTFTRSALAVLDSMTLHTIATTNWNILRSI